MRQLNWDVHLARWATRRNGEPFAWGQTDCWMLCFEAYDALMGTQVAEQYRGRWYSRTSALRERQAGFDLAPTLLALGCEEIAPGFQQRGDFVLIEREPFTYAHVCFGGKALSSSIDGRVTWGTLNFGVPEGMRILRAV